MMLAKKVLILGANGNLGSQLLQLMPDSFGWDKKDADVTDFDAFSAKFNSIAAQIDTVINCVAYNDVDGAENQKDLAFKLNAEFPRLLATLTNQHGITLVHYSTGYVFSGHKPTYVETDTPDPISVYGASKAQGEKYIEESTDTFYIIRTNILFGPKGKSEISKPSVVDIMRERGMKDRGLKGVTDEVASFTYTPDLAAATKELVFGEYPFGIYHLINEGSGSWYELAKEIFKIIGEEIIITPVESSEFKRAARRPRSSVLINTKLPNLRPWQDALREYLKLT